MSSHSSSSSPLKPSFPLGQHTKESSSTRAVIDTLKLEPHIEGGYFCEIDRSPLTIPNPFPPTSDSPKTAAVPMSCDDALRNASTSIYYLLSPVRPQGHFHRNRGRTVHTLIQGKGRYVLIHADEDDDRDGGKRVESFVVGKDVAKGERAVWIVEGGKYKASYLSPMGEGEEGEDRLLISETVIPGFEYSDHDFLDLGKFGDLVTEEKEKELEWLVRRT